MREILAGRKSEKARPMPLPSDVKKLREFYKAESEKMDLIKKLMTSISESVKLH